MGTDDFAVRPMPPGSVPPGAVAAFDQLQAWSRERVGGWGQPWTSSPPREQLEVAGYKPCRHEQETQRLRLVNEALLAVVALLLDTDDPAAVQRLQDALDRAEVRRSGP